MAVGEFLLPHLLVDALEADPPPRVPVYNSLEGRLTSRRSIRHRRSFTLSVSYVSLYSIFNSLWLTFSLLYPFKSDFFFVFVTPWPCSSLAASGRQRGRSRVPSGGIGSQLMGVDAGGPVRH